MTNPPETCERQKDHEGKTSKPEPTEFETHALEACFKCSSGSLSITEP